MVSGQTEGIKKTILQEIENLYDFEAERGDFLESALLETLAYLTQLIKKEIGVYITRDNRIVEVVVGEHDRVSLPIMSMRRNLNNLSGIRCVHTHPGGDGQLSHLDMQSLRKMCFDAIVAVGVVEGIVSNVQVGFLGQWQQSAFDVVLFGPYFDVDEIPQKTLKEQIRISEEWVRDTRPIAIEQGPERAILVGLYQDDGERSMQELKCLVDTAGAEIIHKVIQKRQKPDAATYFGTGKVDELGMLVQAHNADVVIVDDELSGLQTRNLEARLGVKVIDRTALILDIFAMRAISKEGKLQVALAQMKYRLPRLIGLGMVLSRLGGGIGTRGPGETKLEVDRRRIRKSIHELEQELEKLVKQRNLRRAQRQRSEIPVVALVGYTNAGKSTLLNALSGSDVFVEDKLFATLDPTARKVLLPSGRDFILIDTVGFIHKLPHDLVDAFHSTLEETLFADLLLHVIDASSEDAHHQKQVVEEVLAKLGAHQKPTLLVCNKVDKVEGDAYLCGDDEAVHISAKEGTGLDKLQEAIEKQLFSLRRLVTLHIPFSAGQALSFIHESGQIVSEDYTDKGTQVQVFLKEADFARVQKMLCSVDN